MLLREVLGVVGEGFRLATDRQACVKAWEAGREFSEGLEVRGDPEAPS